MPGRASRLESHRDAGGAKARHLARSTSPRKTKPGPGPAKPRQSMTVEPWRSHGREVFHLRAIKTNLAYDPGPHWSAAPPRWVNGGFLARTAATREQLQFGREYRVRHSGETIGGHLSPRPPRIRCA